MAQIKVLERHCQNPDLNQNEMLLQDPKQTVHPQKSTTHPQPLPHAYPIVNRVESGVPRGTPHSHRENMQTQVNPMFNCSHCRQGWSNQALGLY